jgi:2-polyprenyl-3-methyl-5-hydroxy-6-metoxy-1,4-benzoquinol methylase
MDTLEILSSGEPKTPLRLKKMALVDKEQWILEKIRGKSVLHIGPTDFPATLSKARAGRLLHPKLKSACQELIGLDLAESAIEALRQEFAIDDILYGNAEQLETIFPPDRFDVILAGDVIEHMNNMGNFFCSARKVLKPDGILIITTPNSFAIKRMLGAIVLRQERNNPDHLYFFSMMTLWQAATRFGYRITDFAGFMYEAPGDVMNQRGNFGAKIIMKLTGNNFLADELAVCMKPAN